MRTWSFLCVRIHQGVGHTNSELAQHFFTQKNSPKKCLALLMSLWILSPGALASEPPCPPLAFCLLQMAGFPQVLEKSWNLKWKISVLEFWSFDESPGKVLEFKKKGLKKMSPDSTILHPWRKTKIRGIMPPDPPSRLGASRIFTLVLFNILNKVAGLCTCCLLER